MKQEHQPRLVQVLADRGPEQDYEVATGFTITASRILTSAHVLAGATALRVRWLGAVRSDWLAVTQVWPRAGDPAPDVAVLQVDSGAVRSRLGGSLEPVLASFIPGEQEPWSSQGILRAAKTYDEQDRPVSHAEDFGGRLYPAKESEGGAMSLEVDSAPEVAQGWQGASGSPVFARGGLLAVVCSRRLAWRESPTASAKPGSLSNRTYPTRKLFSPLTTWGPLSYRICATCISGTWVPFGAGTSTCPRDSRLSRNSLWYLTRTG